MKIVLTFDTAYAPHAATVMESIIENCPSKLDFAIIYYDLTHETIEILKKHFKDKVSCLDFFKISQEAISKFRSVQNVAHITGLNVFLRLLIPQILPSNDRYVLYLDCDIIVQDNILNITTKMDWSKPVGAVVEYDPDYKLRKLKNISALHEKPLLKFSNIELHWYKVYRNLGLTLDTKYFNAGVMIINLDYWRKYNIAEKAIDFLLTNPKKTICADQDALNHVINGNLHILHPKWNAFVSEYIKLYTNYPKEYLMEATKKPSIIHTAGKDKPWHYMSDRKEQTLYT